MTGIDRDTHVALAATLDAFIPRIAAAADAIDETREIPPELAAAMAEGGLFRLLLPSDLAGPDTPYPVYLRAVQTIAEVDGSAAWCVNQGCVYATIERALPEETRRAIWDDPRAVLANGPPIEAAATAVGGGHILSGQWWFSSGSPHATWFGAQAGVDGAQKETRVFLLPRAEVDLLDTWQVAGLRGTGSHEFRVSQLFVPQVRSLVVAASREPTRTLHAIPTSLLFAGGFAAVALGVARAALDFTLRLTEGKAQRFQRRPLRDQSWVQDHIGRAETSWRAADVFLHTTVERAWESALSGQPLSPQELALMRMASTDGIRQAGEAVELAYNVVGTDGIFQDRGFQRRYQDLHVITQHVQARTTHYESLGRFFLGMEFNADSL